MEYVELKENVAVVLSRTNVGVINQKYLIDTGINEEVGRKLRKTLDAQGIKIERVYNTHGHIDHMGGNIYFYKKGCKIFMPEGEEIFLKYPEITGYVIEYPDFKPIKEIKEIETTIDIEHVPLPGHAFNQVGYVVDKVFFCGDVVVSEAYIEKHKILFHTDITAQKETLNTLMKTDYEYYVPSHCEDVLKNIKPLAKKNLENIETVEKIILDLIDNKTAEALLKELIEYMSITISQRIEHFVYRKLLQNYLKHLYRQGRIRYEYDSGEIKWTRVE